MGDGIADYNLAQTPVNRAICDLLAAELARGLPGAEGRVWHGGPVWFLTDNPVAGYWVRKAGVQLLFWSGQSFDEPGLAPEGKFKAAQVLYPDLAQIGLPQLRRWLGTAAVIQWDYKNIVKRKGRLEKLGDW